MKLSIVKMLSAAVALPIAIVSLIIANPASAEQIGRRNTIDESATPVTDLNLTIPADRESSTRKNSPTPERNLSKLVTSKQSKKVESKSKRNSTISTNINPPTSIKSNSITSKHKIAANSIPPLAGNYLRLVRNYSKGTNDIGNPIYTLEAYVNGRKYRSFNAVSGTATTQNRDRDTANNYAPLPDGLYKVSNWIAPSNIPEVGKTFVSIFPQFETERSELGIHQDVSYNKRNGYDGTAGCIGLVSTVDRDALNNFVTKYHPHNLIVRIAPKT